MKSFWNKSPAPLGAASGWNILLVCMGNICRSPIAEGVLRQRVAEAGLTSHLRCDSAGTHGYHAGEAPDERARRIAGEAGIDLTGLRARPVLAEDFARFDWVLAMDRSNLLTLRRDCPPEHQHKVQLFLEFAGAAAAEVPDPYYGNLDGFRTVLTLCEQGAAGVIRRWQEHADKAARQA